MMHNSLALRNKLIKLDEKKVLISSLKNTTQETDITLPINCNGHGRIRHFRVFEHSDWVCDPLPNYPACEALKINIEKVLKTQLFQVAGCNWNCWFCFVDDESRNANLTKSAYLSVKELISLYLKEQNRPKVIVLSGGQPDLVPEWIYWTIEECVEQELEDEIYIWSDDNLSTDYYFKYLSKDQREKISFFSNYGKVGCFKGFDEKSFEFNTGAPRKKFYQQFNYFNNLRLEKIDLYGYVTFTSPLNKNLNRDINRFIDRLIQIHDKLPLKIVPLKIVDYNVVKKTMKKVHHNSIKYQKVVLKEWLNALEEKYSKKERKMKINNIKIN